MKKAFNIMRAAAPLLAACFLLPACVKDSGTRTVKVYTPVYKSAEEVRAEIKSDAPQPVETPGKLVVLGDYIFLNEVSKGVHIIDNSNPSAPVNKAFIHIPDNGDIAVQGNTLYADCYTDLMAIDISDPMHATLKAHADNLFPDRAIIAGRQMPEGKILTGFVIKDAVDDLPVKEGQGIWKNGSYYYNSSTVYPAEFSDSYNFYLAGSAATDAKSAVTGRAGSTSRFAIVGPYLYAVSGIQLTTVNIANSAAPLLSNTQYLGIAGETIYPFNGHLFIGGTTGIRIFDLADPEKPAPKGAFSHFCSGDPVIADNNVAYVTLHTGNSCGGAVNELDVLNVSDISHPAMIGTYPMNKPYGLSKDGRYLFICDDGAGLKIFDAGDPADIKLVNTVAADHPFDVISNGHIAVVSAGDGLYQFDYSDISRVRLLSKIGVNGTF